jgi:methionyl-tRNA formyltransferase
MTSWPGAFSTINGKTIKILEGQVAHDDGGGSLPGTIVSATKQGVVVACGTGTLAILRAQVEGRKPLSAAELVAGRTLSEGMVFGAGPEADGGKQEPARLGS